MKKEITIKTSGSDSNKYYKIEEYKGTYQCYIGRFSTWSSNWDSIGKAKVYDDALALIRSHASQFGSITDFEIK